MKSYSSHNLKKGKMEIINNHPGLNFQLPNHLKCAKPTELRGIARDEVKLMVSWQHNNHIKHNIFRNIGNYLKAGDTLVVNTSGTLKAALPIQLPNGNTGRVHLSTKLQKNQWVVEIREIRDNATHRHKKAYAGQSFQLPEDGEFRLLRPFYKNNDHFAHLNLWVAQFDLNTAVPAFLKKYGTPIRYDKVDQQYPIEYYQTIFAQHPGSAEMPSAGRAFTPQLVKQLIAKGIQFAPVLLHTGVSSLEEGEKPYPEYYEVSPLSADLINAAKTRGGRIIAVGTTAIRTLESIVDEAGKVQAGSGWTDLYLTPDYQMKVVDGLLTGFHEPKASHLSILESVSSLSHLEYSYPAALKEGYQWHEFGDLHLILP